MEDQIKLFMARTRARQAGDHEAVRRCNERAAEYVERARRRYFVGLAQRNAPVVQDIRPLVATAVRPRERRDATGRSSARSGDSGSDDDPSSRPASREGGRP